MKALNFGIQGRRRYLSIEIILLISLVSFAIYLWTAPQRAERALANASLSELKDTVRQNPKRARAFYYLGVREEQAGDIPAAFDAYTHAAQLDSDDEASWLKASALTSQIYGDQGAFDLLTLYLKRHPGSAPAHLAKAQLYRKNQAHERALQEATAAAQCDSHLAEAWYIAGLSANSLNVIGKAEEAMRRAVALAPKDWRYQLILGDILARQNRDQEAISCYQTAIRLAPHEGVPYLSLGKMQLDLARSPTEIDAARRTLQQSTALQPDIPIGYLLIGLSCTREGKWREARDPLERASRLAPTDPDPVFELARVYRHLGDGAAAARATKRHQQLRAYQQAKLALQERLMVVTGDTRETRLKLARLCSDNGDNAEAVQQYRRILAREPGAEDVKAALAAVESRIASAQAPSVPAAASAFKTGTTSMLGQADALLSQKRYPEAELAYIRVLKQYKSSALACQGLGLTLSAEGKQDRALIFLQDATRLDPTLSPAQYVLSQAYMALGFPREARRRMLAVVAREPNHADYWHLLGAACGEAEPYYSQAEDAYRRAAALAPDNMNDLLDLADMLVKTNKSAEAEATYRRALAMAPEDPEALARLGMFLADDRPDPARQHEADQLLHKSLAIRPADPYALYALGRVYLNEGRAQFAIDALKNAITHASQPDTAELWYALSRAYIRIGDHLHADQAQAVASRLREGYQSLKLAEDQAARSPRDTRLMLKLARLYARRGENAKAIDLYEGCLRIDSGNGAARKELAALEDRLKANGKMPSMTAFHLMIAAAQSRPVKGP